MLPSLELFVSESKAEAAEVETTTLTASLGFICDTERGTTPPLTEVGAKITASGPSVLVTTARDLISDILLLPSEDMAVDVVVPGKTART